MTSPARLAIALAIAGHAAASHLAAQSAPQQTPDSAQAADSAKTPPAPVVNVGGPVKSGAKKATPPTPAPPQVPLAFDSVTIVDVTTGKLVPKQTVVVEGNRIRAIGPAGKVAVPDSAKVISAAGKYLIPGLWDMHAHIDDRVSWYPLFIAHGVTGTREMAQRFPHGTDSFRVWQREVMEGKRIGPRSYGPSADLTNANGIEITTPEDADRVIDSLKAAGALFLKYHDDNGDPELFYAMIGAAKRNKLPLVGHASTHLSDVETADAGLASLEHAQESHECWNSFPGWPEPPNSPFAKKRCQPIADAFIRNGTWLTPTLVVFYYQDEGHTQDAQKFLQTIHSLGVRNFLAGSDASQNGNILGVQLEPGFSLLQEVVLMVGGGLSPLEALQSATLNPAKFMKATDSLGTVATGKLADLVLLDDNPVADIRNVLKVRAVVANGRFFDRALLDSMDPEGMKRAAKFAEQQASVVQPSATTESKKETNAAPPAP